MRPLPILFYSGIAFVVLGVLILSGAITLFPICSISSPLSCLNPVAYIGGMLNLAAGAMSGLLGLVLILRGRGAVR